MITHWLSVPPSAFCIRKHLTEVWIIKVVVNYTVRFWIQSLHSKQYADFTCNSVMLFVAIKVYDYNFVLYIYDSGVPQ